jgi:hypothetical protein
LQVTPFGSGRSYGGKKWLVHHVKTASQKSSSFTAYSHHQRTFALGSGEDGEIGGWFWWLDEGEDEWRVGMGIGDDGCWVGMGGDERPGLEPGWTECAAAKTELEPARCSLVHHWRGLGQCSCERGVISCPRMREGRGL